MSISTIRRSKKDDLGGIKKVYKSRWAADLGRIKELLENPSFDPNGLVVAEKNGEVLGFASHAICALPHGWELVQWSGIKGLMRLLLR